jgi:DNA-binding MarR family transcriptional regulator
MRTGSKASLAVGDSVERVLAGWHAARPDLDVEPIAVLARLARLRMQVDQRLDAVFARHGLRAPSFAVLATLARLDAPHVPQHRLAAELGLTAGTLSVRIDRLAADGLVTREPDPSDGRGALIALTARGRDAFEACAPEHLANARGLLAGLEDEERERLAALLGKLLGTLEHAGPDEVLALRLGVVLDPAPAADDRRRAVGLAPIPGLLVRHVDPTGPAAAAGLERGDLVTGVAGRRIRTHADLRYEVEAAGPDTLVLDVVRGARRRRITIAAQPAPPSSPASRARRRPAASTPSTRRRPAAGSNTEPGGPRVG